MSIAVVNFESARTSVPSSGFKNLMLTEDPLGGDLEPLGNIILPSILRNANRRFYMDLIDTTKVPDFKTLTDISYDHDIHTATNTVAMDVVNGMRIGGVGIDEAVIEPIDVLDEKVDIPEIYRNIAQDELKFGNALAQKFLEFDAGAKIKRFVDLDMIHPGRVRSMELSIRNTPMWWSFTRGNKDDAVYLDPKYTAEFRQTGVTGEIVGEADEIAFFNGQSMRYQTWGVGITQIARLLIEAKLDMLIDFSKIIKREASPKEYMYVNVKGLGDAEAEAKIQNTITEVSRQRKLGSIIVMGKEGQEDVTDVKVVGSEGKVLDNFTLHYRDYILHAIRVMTRLPPAFWLGESTNKATVNTQLIVYNNYINSIRYHINKRIYRQIFKPYLDMNKFTFDIRIKEVPRILFNPVQIMDETDRAFINDVYVRLGCKSRRQVAEEQGFELPEDAKEIVPELSGKGEIAELYQQRVKQVAIGVEEYGPEEGR